MPRYHFNLLGRADFPDHEGCEISGLKEARSTALRYAADVLRGEAKTAAVGEAWRVEVTDGTGLILFMISVSIGD